MNSIYADHWLYNYIPRNQSELPTRSCWQKITWALWGNDDDGIFGEGPKSGHRWLEKWHGKVINKKERLINPGQISFKRFVAWQMRNPLHNFTAYVVGFKGAQKITIRQLALVTTKQIRLYQKLKKINVFPMQNYSGLYIGLHNGRPFTSWRVCLANKWLEGYSGWRPNGGFGLALRLKNELKNKPPQ